MKAEMSRLAVGQTARRERTVTQADIAAFAEVSGDHNPVHLDPEFARDTIFGGVIAHGMLSAAFISELLATDLPGEGAVYLEQSLRFRAPVRPGNTVVIEVEVLELFPSRKRVRLRTTCSVDGTAVLTGEALMMVQA